MSPDPSPLTIQIGARFRAIRHATGLSQDKYAKHLGVHFSLIGHIERGTRNLTLQTIERLAERMGVTTDDLLCGHWEDESPRRPKV
ncbi:helix-turn-helix domain-containing protein [Nocardioides alcanivorans]|uniref:helix-turn-helix domain-containing protein n=1 Tax=Nocardioides alcanivorans TaxID=2897352 RepID=UPI001F22A01C|nr:helix-turn-helix transcriptional regulator [Nocardioides alcanivorans]